MDFMNLHYFDNGGMKTLPKGGNIIYKAIRTQNIDSLFNP